MKIKKYSPKWLLKKINDSKTDAHKLMHIIEYRKELIENYKKQLNLTDVSESCNCDCEGLKEDIERFKAINNSR